MKKADKKSSFIRVILRALRVNRTFTCKPNNQEDLQRYDFRETKIARLKAECDIARAYLFVERKKFNL